MTGLFIDPFRGDTRHGTNHSLYIMSHSVTATIGQSPITIETGKLARLADGAVTVRCGETIVLVSAVSATTVKEGQDLFPLTVDYREKAAAVGKFPGGYFKREGRPTEKEILTCRMTDRPLRPLFPKGYLYDTQIIGVLLSADGEHDPDILFINGASAALCVSDIPFAGPVGAVRVGRINGQFVANPTHSERVASDLDLVYVGNRGRRDHDRRRGEGTPRGGIRQGARFCADSSRAPHPRAEGIGCHGRQAQAPGNALCCARRASRNRLPGRWRSHRSRALHSQQGRPQKAVEALKDEVSAAIREAFPEATTFEISQAFDYLQKKAFRISILDKKVRCDGRGFDEIRPLSAEIGLLPRTHGSALFQRGETQALSLATLAPADEAQDLDGYTGGETSKRFILHYNFPPFSVGETGRTGGPGRREIGHGALAERSIAPVIPEANDFPYAIRVSSEVMESNGSTSMASVCAGVLALMDAGVPISKPVAGISCGLVTEFSGRHHFPLHHCSPTSSAAKITSATWTSSSAAPTTGVTGFQLDLKLPGIPLKILEEAIYRTRDARIKILDVMNAALDSPRAELSPYAPRIETIRIKPDKIGLIIGPGGKTIKGIVAETGAEINIEDDGTVHIYSNNGESLKRAKEIILGMTKEITVGEMYQGTRRYHQGVRLPSSKSCPARTDFATSPNSPTSA